MKKMLSLAAAGALVFAACGGDDDGGGGDSADDLVNALVIVFESDDDLEGVELDQDCLRGIAEGIPAGDRAELIASINEDRDPEGISPETEAASVEILDCIDFNFDELLTEE